jgi:uncharacterized protein
MKIAVTGASGLMGRALVPSLRADGHEVLRLVRRTAAAPDEVSWDPEAGTVDLRPLEGTGAFVHLAAAGIGDHRWTDSYKQEVLDSRRQGTDTIARAAAVLDPRSSVLVSASAMGYYGNTGDADVDETGPKGQGFASDVVEAWEQAADPARDAGVRVVHPRTGLVVAAEGGAWGRMLPLFRLGLGGRLGSGHQWWSFISLTDQVAALKTLIDSDLSGPVNLTTPHPATNAEVTKAMGEALHRPTLLPVPSFALRTVLGEFSSEVLSSSRVMPGVLTKAGFPFSHPTIESAIRSIL